MVFSKFKNPPFFSKQESTTQTTPEYIDDLQLLTPKQVAKLLAVTEVCVYQWAKRGIIPHFKVEKCVRFSKDDLRAFLESRRVEKR